MCVLTSSWTLILPRNISNRPKHSHLPLLCPSICLPSFFLSPCLIISKLLLFHFSVAVSVSNQWLSASFLASKVSFLSFQRSSPTPLWCFFPLLILSFCSGIHIYSSHAHFNTFILRSHFKLEYWMTRNWNATTGESSLCLCFCLSV